MSRRYSTETPGLFDTLDAETAFDLPDLPASWLDALRPEFAKPYYRDLIQFVADERSKGPVFPPVEDVFNALKLTPLDQVRVLILGQDPYHDDGQAHGLCFSVRHGVAPPPSLKNIVRELHDDLGCAEPNHGCLEAWARKGVLLLNAVLTVRAHEPASHQRKGWEQFTDAIIRIVNAKSDPVVFVLWGAHAQKKIKLIDTTRHLIIQSAHPSPLSASNGFFGSRPFSKINAFLRDHGLPTIDWQIANTK
jgi:uracil-DNA glycosylase